VSSQRFPRSRRLRKRREFLAVQRSGKKIHGTYFLIVAADGGGRIGIAVSKKVGNAVKRNRIKRLVREYVRQSEWAPADRDVVVIAKRSAADVAGFSQVAEDLSRLRSRLDPC
jgi:ribonuclease P protein component